MIEVAAYIVMAVIVLGWAAGWQNYFFLLTIAPFLLPMGKLPLKSFFAAASIAMFLSVRHFYLNATPIYILSPFIIEIIYYYSILSVGLFLFLIGNLYSSAADRAEDKLELERNKSEALLLNILPLSIAERLKEEGRSIADGFAETSVLFADIVGFTVLSAKTPPAEIVALLNSIFSRFDDLLDNRGLEKIKTIGDAYMVAAGIPDKNEHHAQDTAEFALEMRDALTAFNHKSKQNLRLRIGINSGPVTAGVIGKKKFIYDLWGDCVNTAARMESHGIAGEIQVTETTYALLKYDYNFEERGEIDVKGKGMMRTYLLKGRKNELR